MKKKYAYGEYADYSEGTAKLLRKMAMDDMKPQNQKYYNFPENQSGVGIRKVIETDSKKMKVAGYAAIFNSESVDLGGYTEVLLSGCFKNALSKAHDVRALFNHDEDLILGRTASGTLRLREDHIGLAFELDLPDTQAGRDVYTSVKRGDLSQCSFGFRLTNGGCYFEENIRYIRTIYELFDISVVTFPAYPETSVGIRKLFLEKQRAGELRVKKSNLVQATLRANQNQNLLDYDNINSVRQLFEISQKRKLTDFQLALIGTKFNIRQFGYEKGDKAEILEFKTNMLYVVSMFSVKEGDCDKNDIRSITELFFWHEKGIVNGFELGGLAKKIDGVDEFIADPNFYSENFVDFCLKIVMEKYGFGRCYQQNKQMQAGVRELKKQGIESAAPWEIAPKEWKMTKAGYKHILEL